MTFSTTAVIHTERTIALMIYKYDGRGEKCPVPLVNLRLLLKKINPNDECIIIIDDLGSITDIPKLLAKKGYDYREQIKANGMVEISVKALDMSNK